MTFQKTDLRDTLVRAIAILGLVAILVLGAWGIILIATNLPSFFTGLTSLFERRVTAPEAPAAAPIITPTTAPTYSTPAKTSTTATPAGASMPAPKPVPALYGYPDLAVRIVSVVPSGYRTNATFEVSNIGTNRTPANWNFIATFPTASYGSYPYYSAGQRALNPGDRIVFTLGFDTPYHYGGGYPYYGDQCILIYPPPPGCDPYGYGRSYYGGRTVTVIVDPYNQIYELNELNNTATVSL